MAEKVLIVDDDTRLSAMISDYLSGNGYTVHKGGACFVVDFPLLPVSTNRGRSEA